VQVFLQFRFGVSQGLGRTRAAERPWERGWRVPRTRNKHATRPSPLTVTYLSSIPFSHNPGVAITLNVYGQNVGVKQYMHYIIIILKQ
jgi:hypothetical protein